MSDEQKAFEDGLREKYGEVYKAEFVDVSGEKVPVYYRAPTGPEFDRFTEKSADKDPKRNIGGIKEFGRCVIVHPVGGDLDALLSRRPGILVKIGGDAAGIGSGDAAELGKRL